jgi:hypothetical protein
MQRHTQESFVFAYGKQSMKVVKSSAILTGAKLSQLNTKTVDEFFNDFFMCWAGDTNIKAENHRTLERSAKRFEANSALLLSAKTI